MPQIRRSQRISYWVMKGNRDENDWSTLLQQRSRDTWHTAKLPPELRAGDRLFCWESRAGLHVVGLAEVVNPHAGKNDHGESLFEVRFLTDEIRAKPTSKELRLVPTLKRASFLEPGDVRVLYPLNAEQAALLLAILRERNPEQLSHIWDDSQLDPDVAIQDPELADSGSEGRLRLMVHFLRERDQRLVQRKKQSVLKLHCRLACEVCGFDFEKRYGPRGYRFCEVHHRIPLSQVNEETTTKLTDLAIVCSNCHRMLHREPEIDIGQLSNSISGLAR